MSDPNLTEIKERLEKDPNNFERLEEYANYADSHTDASIVEAAYTRLLDKYPLCYAYWKRYADKVLALGGKSESAVAAATAIYEQSTSLLRYSVENWINYVRFLIANVLKNNPSGPSSDEAVTRVRGIFEAATEAVGDNFDAYDLWSLRIDFEQEFGGNRLVAAVYERANSVPMKSSAILWDRYLRFMHDVHFEEWLRSDELQAWKDQRATLCHTSEDEQRLFNDTLTAAIGERERVYNQSMTAVYRVAGFENTIAQRTFFHVTPLPDSVVNGWRTYLQWAESNEPFARAAHLYERCLIPACFYTEFWFRYISFLKRNSAVDMAREVFQSGARVHYAENLDFMISYAVFEESYGGNDKGESIYRKLMEMTAVPGKSIAASRASTRGVEVTTKYAAFLRRTGKIAECKKLFEEATAPHDGMSRRSLFLLLHYARFMEQLGEIETARNLYIRGTREHAKTFLAWNHAIAFEIRRRRLSGEAAAQAQTSMAALLHRAVLDSCPLGEEDKKRLWKRWWHLTGLWENSLETVLAVDADYALVCGGARPLWVHDNLDGEPPEKLAKLSSETPSSGVPATSLLTI